MEMFNHSEIMTLNDQYYLDEILLNTLFSKMFELVFNTCISYSIGIFGIAANIINMAVFYRQGLKSSINISFFTTAVSDMCRILLILWPNVCVNPYIDTIVAQIFFLEFYYLTGGWVLTSWARITLHVTVYITAERCLCLICPLAVKTIMTPFRAKLIIAFIVSINSIAVIPEYASVYLDWRFSKELNKTMLGVGFRSNRAELQGVSFLLHSILLLLGLCCVVVLTFILVIQLRRQSKWRSMNSAKSKHRIALSKRDRKSVVLVILVATSVVVSFIPLAALSLVTILVREFDIHGKFSLLFFGAWSVNCIFGLLNSSTNIIIYYKMNSKFKNTFKEIFLKT